MADMKTLARFLWTAGLLLAAVLPVSAQAKVTVVPSPLTTDLVKLFPEIASGYVDFSANGKADQTSDLNEYIPESRVRDGQLQAQEILDFLLANWRFLSLDKLKAVRTAVKASAGAINELIAIAYASDLDEAVVRREAMGDGLYLTPSAYKEAMARLSGLITAMANAYKKEGGASDKEFTTARDSLFDAIDKGYPLPGDLPAEERSVLSTSMIGVVLKDQSANPGRVKTAIRVLGLLKAAEGAPYLNDLAAGGPFVIEAMKALGDIGWKASIPAIAAQLKANGPAEVRKAAFSAIGAIGGAEALDTILDIVKPATRDSLTPELLEASVAALAGIAAKGNTEFRILTALKELSGHSRPVIRRLAAQGLGAFNQPQSFEALQALVNTEKDAGVRRVAVVSLSKQSNEGVMATLLRVLREKDLDPGLKTVGLTAVGDNLSGAQGIQVLVDALADAEPAVRQAASASLRKLAVVPANLALVSGALSRTLIASSNEPFLVEGTGLLALLADPASLPSLLTLLAKPVPEVKRMAAWALYRLRSSANPKVVEELAKLVTNESEGLSTRVTAVRALGAIAFDSPQLNLWQTLVTTTQMRGEKYAMLRYQAVKALGSLLPMKPQTAAALVRLAVRDPDAELRKAALQSLKMAGGLDEAAGEALAGSFADGPDLEYKVTLIETLADQGQSRCADLARDLLGGDLGLPLKRRVIAALAQLPTDLTASVILDAAKDSAAGDFIVSVLGSFPAKLLSATVQRRQRTETDKTIIGVLNSLEAMATE